MTRVELPWPPSETCRSEFGDAWASQRLGSADASDAYDRRCELSRALHCVIIHRVRTIVVRRIIWVEDQRRTACRTAGRPTCHALSSYATNALRTASASAATARQRCIYSGRCDGLLFTAGARINEIYVQQSLFSTQSLLAVLHDAGETRISRKSAIFSPNAALQPRFTNEARALLSYG